MSQDSSSASSPPLAPPSPPGERTAGQVRPLLRNKGFLIALAIYVASRVYFGLIFAAGTTDIYVYFEYAVQAHDFGETPYSQSNVKSDYYRDLADLEYPPVGYWVTALPRLFPHTTLPRGPEEIDVAQIKDIDPRLGLEDSQAQEFWRRYGDEYEVFSRLFRTEMLLCDIGSFLLFCAILLRRRPELLVWGMLGYTLSTSLLGYVMFERFDVVLTFALLAWAYCWLRAGEPDAKTWAWSAAAYTALGLGISLKLIPILLVPFALLCDLYALVRTPRRWSLLVGPAMLLVAALGPFAYYYALVGDDLSGMFQYHSERGIQIESSYATLMMLLKPADELYCYFNYGSWNLGGALEEPLRKASMWILVAALAGLGLRSLVAPLIGEKYDRAASYRMACVAIPVATLLAKVFSPQYMLWAAPMLLLAASEFFPRRAFIVAAVLTSIACACTGFIFPYHYLDHMKVFPYSEERPPYWTLITALQTDRGMLDTGLARAVIVLRNLVYGGVCAAVYVQALRRTKAAR